MTAYPDGEAQMPQDGQPRIITVRGLGIEVLVTGSGPAVVLIHGTGASWRVWQHNVAALASTHTVIAPSLPGCGGSDRLPERPADLAPYADALEGLLTELGVERAVVAGHSLGGLVALRFACDHPGRVRSLVLVDSGGVQLSRPRLMMITWSLRAASALCRRRWFTTAFLRRPGIHRRALAALFEDPSHIGSRFLADALEDFAAPGVPDSIVAGARDTTYERTTTIDAPIHLMWGRMDSILPLRLGRALQDTTPNSTLMIMDTGHCPMLEQPRQFDEYLTELCEHAPA